MIIPTVVGLVVTGVFLVSKSDLMSSVGARFVSRLCEDVSRGHDCSPVVSNSFNEASLPGASTDGRQQKVKVSN